ncbi:hypothetical protein HOC99_02865 [Candidatus Woesearchaeota archaeon]|jgi:hypothetical protein|nr:hypothetical protein [Candidatus Woesearchaeota archaeon]MBT4595849.1 hypothetical protein [Candidatus Woesearchaeota archaeon]MBT5741302.1 hypothetical protein [Candidatus Woesearchaeota archaeon]MBT7296801.1 hypothetical protein [Candidatus Woesearchaeota archaeon]MBT7849214.1 hypothetical protein [Candidatus Woesearchaeota archaeon]
MKTDPFTNKPLRNLHPLIKNKKFEYEPLIDERKLYDGEPFFHHGHLATTKDIGKTVVDHGAEKNMISAIENAAKQGARSIELTPNASGQAPGQGIESIGTEHRKQISDFTKLNKMCVTGVHVNPSQVGNLSGFNPQDKTFSEKYRNYQLSEIKKGIDFNSDIQGGGVVFHTNEFARHNWSELDNLGNDIEFVPQGQDKQNSDFIIVDKRTEQAQTVPQNYEFNDIDIKRSNDFKQPFEVKIEKKNWNELKKDFNQKELEKELNKKFQNEEKIIDPSFSQSILFNLKKNEINTINSQLEYTEFKLKQLSTQKNEFKKLHEANLQVETKLTKEENKRMKKIYPDLEFLGEISESEYYNYKLKEATVMLSDTEQKYGESHIQKKRIFEDINNVKSGEEFGFEKSVNSLVDLAKYAKKKTDENKNIEKPIFLAPENIFPDNGFGAHPQEMKKLIIAARQKFTNELLKSGKCKNYKEAFKKAKQHIRSTFDTQHMGMWFANMKDKPNETSKQKIKRFKKWYIDQVKDTSKEDMYGGMHIVDGFTGHTHVDLGQGIHPIKEAVKIISNNTEGFLALNSEAYEGGDMLEKVWDFFAMPMRAPKTGIEADAFAKSASMSTIDSAFAGIQMHNDAKIVKTNSTPTMYNSSKSHPQETDMNQIQNWDGLPLE